jgi:uncharacterized protein (DUF2141 family)
MTSRELGGAALALCTLLASSARGDASTITVHVTNVRSGHGSVMCRLYAGSEGFPGKDVSAASVSAPIVDKTATCAFAGVAPGTYAVSAFHDENGNGKLDRNFIGIPKEGVGVSNNRLHAMGPPKWEESKFVVSGSATLEIKLRY